MMNRSAAVSSVSGTSTRAAALAVCPNSVGRRRSRASRPSATAAARARLKASAAKSQRHTTVQANGKYYGEAAQVEETLVDVIGGLAGVGRITRNHYGSLVLNAASALFIDIDMLHEDQSSPPFDLECRQWKGPWRRTLSDVCWVLTRHCRNGFRVYRTAAGFRLLATTHEFEPGSAASERLMNLVGADPTFRRLCRIQNSFRARLTPKPWRCGAGKPPNFFPRQTAADEESFADWLDRYERACLDWATCQFLDQIGPRAVHERIAPVLDIHDRLTKANEPLALA